MKTLKKEVILKEKGANNKDSVTKKAVIENDPYEDNFEILIESVEI